MIYYKAGKMKTVLFLFCNRRQVYVLGTYGLTNCNTPLAIHSTMLTVFHCSTPQSAHLELLSYDFYLKKKKVQQNGTNTMARTGRHICSSSDCEAKAENLKLCA